MAKVPHEALHHIFREEPDLFCRVMNLVLDEDFPVFRNVSVLNSDLTEISQVVRHADTVLQAETSEGSQIIVVEPQTKPEKKKHRSWAYYISYLENRYELPVTLLVVTPHEATARWARGPISLGPSKRPSLQVFPLVAGPDNTPLITEPEIAAEDVAFAVFAALTHRESPEIENALNSLAHALSKTDIDTAVHLAEFTEAGLGDGCAETIWRRIIMTMTYPFATKLHAELEAKGREKGRVEGQAGMLLMLLDHRGVTLTEVERERIATCTDEERLADWAVKAVSVSSAAELFS